MFSPDLNRLIEASLTDGVLTDQERAVIKKRALLEGIDPDEVDVLLDSKLQEMRQKAEEAVAKVRKCPACGAIISAFQTVCPQCGNEITNGEASKSMQKLSDMINDVTASELDPKKRQERIKNIIKSFPVPTTKGDILDFLFLAAPYSKKNNNIMAKIGPALTCGGIGFIVFFLLFFIINLTNKNSFGDSMGNSLLAGLIFGSIAALVGKKVFKEKMEPIMEQNKMADTWKAKCTQVLAKAKYTLKSDVDAMNYINQIEQQINSK